MWEQYIHEVYGELGGMDFPLDLRCFTFWWKRSLPSVIYPTFYKHYHASATNATMGDVLDIGYRKLAWQVYLLEHSDFDVSLGRVLNGSIPIKDIGGVMRSSTDNQWVEIFHDMDDCTHASRSQRAAAAPQVGYWAHYAPGSGIFANLGRTLVSDRSGYVSACQALLPSVQACKTSMKTSIPAHMALRQAAILANFSSLQSCCGPRGGNPYVKFFEIAFFLSECPETRSKFDRGSCPSSGLQLMQGRSNQKQCACNPSFVNSNCDRGFASTELNNLTSSECGGHYDSPHNHLCVSKLARGSHHAQTEASRI